MTEADLHARAKQLSDQLDDEGLSLGDQVAILGSVLAAALTMLPPELRALQLNGHLEMLKTMLANYG